MRQATLAILMLAALAGWGADDWIKVRSLQSGTDLKIWRTGSKQVLEAKMDEANDERLLVATKNEQLSIPKDEIERIDKREPKAPKGPKMETRRTITTRSEVPGTDPNKINRPARPGTMPENSVSSSATWGSSGFETVYRKVAVSGKKPAEK